MVWRNADHDGRALVNLIGILVSGTNGASLVGSIISDRSERALGRTWCLSLATLGVGLGIAALGVLAQYPLWLRWC